MVLMVFELTTDKYPEITSQAHYPLRHATPNIHYLLVLTGGQFTWYNSLYSGNIQEFEKYDNYVSDFFNFKQWLYVVSWL